MCSGWRLLDEEAADRLIRSKECYIISLGTYLSFSGWF